jgi:hypothetical protein
LFDGVLQPITLTPKFKQISDRDSRLPTHQESEPLLASRSDGTGTAGPPDDVMLFMLFPLTPLVRRGFAGHLPADIETSSENGYDIMV